MDALEALEVIPEWFNEQAEGLQVTNIQTSWEDDTAPEEEDCVVVSRDRETFNYVIVFTAIGPALTISASMSFMTAEAYGAGVEAGLQTKTRVMTAIREAGSPLLNAGVMIDQEETPEEMVFMYERLLYPGDTGLKRQDVLDGFFLICHAVPKATRALDEAGLYGTGEQTEDDPVVSPPEAPVDTPLGSTGGIRGIQ